MRAAKTDTAQAPIVAALRKLGARVVSLHRVGQGVPDLLILHRGKVQLVEVKTGAKGKLTEAQVAFLADGWPVVIIRSVEEAVEWATQP